MDYSITVLGSGTSAGVPTIGCPCAVCHSTDPRDNRMRPSVLVRYAGRNILIDTTPDFRTQALRAGMTRLDAILFTHAHADHIMGLDDVRPLSHAGGAIPLYADQPTLDVIRSAFSYVFRAPDPDAYIPQIEPRVIDGQPFDLFGLRFDPIPVMHGRDVIHGFRFGKAAYLTDHNEIPESSMAKLRGLDVLFLDALRFIPHPTHSTIATSLETARRIGAKRTFFTHMSHDVSHAEAEKAFPSNVRLAYDGLELNVSDAA